MVLGVRKLVWAQPGGSSAHLTRGHLAAISPKWGWGVKNGLSHCSRHRCWLVEGLWVSRSQPQLLRTVGGWFPKATGRRGRLNSQSFSRFCLCCICCPISESKSHGPSSESVWEGTPPGCGYREGTLAPLGAMTVTVYPQEGSQSEMESNTQTSVGCKPCESESMCAHTEGRKTRG